MAESGLDREELRRRIREVTRLADEEYSSPAYLMREKELRHDRRRDVFVAFVMLVAFFAAAVFYAHNYTYTTYSVDAENKLGALQQTEVYAFSEGALAIGGDSITYIVDGTVLWTSAVSLKKPKVAVEGDYFCVCDTDGYQVYICDREGIISNIRLSRKIRSLDISASGVTAVFTESGDAAYVSYFDRYGSRLPVEVKTILEASGYPMHMSVSPDGQKLAMLFYTTSNGIGESRFVLYDFQNGKADNYYIVGTLADYYDTNTLLVDGDFTDDTHYVAIGDNSVTFITYVPKKGIGEPLVMPFENPVRSVFFSGSLFGVVEENERGTECVLRNNDGSEYARFEVLTDYERIRTNGSFLLFQGGEELSFYNVSGRHRYTGNLVSAPVDISFTGERSLLVNTGSLLEKITLK